MDEKAPRTTFMQPLLTKNHVFDPPPLTATLETNTSGTTFAARARAAELKAARARQELKNKSDIAPTSTHESMTFTKGRSKAGQRWKPLNLHDLPEIDEDLSAESSPSASTHNTNMYDGPELFSKPVIRPLVSAQKINMYDGPGLFSNAVIPLVSTPNPFLNPWENNDGNSWNEQAVTEDQRPASRTSSSFGMPSLDPVPVLMSPTAQMRQEADYLAHKQLSQISELQSQLDHETASLHSARSVSSHHAASVASIPRSHPTPQAMMMARFQAQENVSYPPYNEALAQRTAHHLAVQQIMTPQPGQAFSPIQPVQATYTYAPPTKSKPPHLYPAVKGTSTAVAAAKGTMNHTFRFPPGDRPQSEATNSPLATIHENRLVGSPSIRRLSEEEKKDLLRQQLEAVADQEKKVGLVTTSTRTVLHDPFADPFKGSPNSTKNQSTMPSVVSTDFHKSSEPLPWKDRCVNVRHIAEKNSAPPSSVPTQSVSTPTSSAMNIRSPFDIDAWWYADKRFDALTLHEVSEFVNAQPSPTRPIQNTSSTYHSRTPSVIASPATPAPTTRRQQLASTPTPMPRPSPTSAPTPSSALTPHPIRTPGPVSTPTPIIVTAAAAATVDVLAQVIGNLKTYQRVAGYFHKHGPVPDWCVDASPAGHRSFFGPDWGSPPLRLGRDPRYRSVVADGNAGVGAAVGAVGGACGSGGDGAGATATSPFGDAMPWQGDGMARRFRA